jgi:type IV secretory pathway TraG/TraD family ATPase VirD4
MTLNMDLRLLHEKLKDSRIATLLDPTIDKTALSIRGSLANHLDIFECLEDESDGLSLLPFMQNNIKDWLFLSCQTNQRAFLKPIFSVWLSLIIKGVMSRSENNDSRTWIIIDELASLNKLPSLMTGLSEIRKYGGCFVLGFQDLSQIEEIYGFAQAKTLSNLTGTKVLFRAVDTEVANRVARYMGEQEKEELSTNISYGAHQMRDGVSLNQQRQVRSVVRGSDIMLLSDLEAYIKYPGHFPVSKVKFEYLQLTPINAHFIPRPKKISEVDHAEELPESEPSDSNKLDSVTSNVIHPNFNKSNQKQKLLTPKKKDDELTFDL